MSDEVFAFGAYHPRDRALRSDDSNRDASWDWTIDQTYELFDTTGQRFNVRLPYFSPTSPVRPVIGVHDVQPVDGWTLVYRDFGTNVEGTELPRFLLYDRFRGILRFFFYNHKIETAFSSAFVRLRMVIDGEGTTTPPLLTYYAGDPRAYDPFASPDAGFASEYLDDYDPDREVVAVTKLAFREWCVADFVLFGYAPDLGTNPAYTDAAFAFEVVGVDEFELEVDGEVSLQPLYQAGSSNFLLDFASIVNQVPGGTITSAITWFASTADANAADQDEANKAGKLGAAAGFAEIAGAVFKDYLPAAGKVAGFLGKLQGGSAGGKLLELKGSIELKGTITRSAATLFAFLRVPGVMRTRDDSLPFEVDLRVLNLRTKPEFRAVDFDEWGCRPSPFDPNDEVCGEKWNYVSDPVDLVVREDIAGASDVTVEAALAKLSSGLTQTEFVPIDEVGSLTVEARLGPLTTQNEDAERWFALLIRVTVTPDVADPTPAITYKLFVPSYRR